MDIDILLWCVGALLLVAFLIAAVGNAVVFVMGALLRMNAPSIVPLVGGICGAIGSRLIPVESLRSVWWLPLFLDFGCIPFMVIAIACYRSDKRRNGPQPPKTDGR